MLLLALLTSVCACAPAVVPTPLPTTTPLPPRSTLPPTWTPSPSFTPLPPTATATLTPTPTATPTFNPATICETLHVETTLKAGRILAWSHFASFVVTLPAEANLTVRFVAIHHTTREHYEAETPVQDVSILQIPVKLLPLPGRYDWTLNLNSETEGELCPQQGWFIVTRRESTRAAESKLR